MVDSINGVPLPFVNQAAVNSDSVYKMSEVIWNPMPDNSVYQGAECLQGQEIETLDDWFNWFETNQLSKICAQQSESCQIQMGTKGGIKIGEAITECISLDTSDQNILIYDEALKAVRAGGVKINLSCPETINFLNTCPQDADANTKPYFLFGWHQEQLTDPDTNETITTISPRKYRYLSTTLTKLKVTSPVNHQNNRHANAANDSRYPILNAGVDLIGVAAGERFDTATGTFHNGADRKWYRVDLNLSANVKYTPSAANTARFNFLLTVKHTSSRYATDREYRIDESMQYLFSGTNQGVGLKGGIDLELYPYDTLTVYVTFRTDHTTPVDVQVGSASVNQYTINQIGYYETSLSEDRTA